MPHVNSKTPVFGKGAWNSADCAEPNEQMYADCPRTVAIRFFGKIARMVFDTFADSSLWDLVTALGNVVRIVDQHNP